MLTFKTQFPINKNASIADLLEVARTWIAKSPHSSLADELQQAKELVDEGHFSSARENLSVSILSQPDKKSCGVRWENSDHDGLTWVTEVVGCRAQGGFWMSILLNVDAELPVDRIYQGKPPYVLKSIMQTLGGGLDGLLEVSDKPHKLADTDVELAAQLIAGDAGCSMPVAYVSLTNMGRLHVDPDLLAKRLAGMAHVVVEPSRSFSIKLMRACYAENAYGGAVALYWPDGIGKFTFLPKYDDDEDAASMVYAIIRKVRQSLLSQRTRQDCSWSHLQEAKSRERVEALLKNGTGAVEDYIAAFDSELRAKNEHIDQLEQENARLRYNPLAGRVRRDQEESGFLVRSSSDDLYQGERLGLIIELVNGALSQIDGGSRRKDVLLDIISSNQVVTERDELIERLKSSMRGYTSMTGALRSDLEQMGFEVLEEGKHYKLLFRGYSGLS
ncbi:hypothetical protein [Dyella sp. 2RAB6]|uniref:hypothetical protein n=1 Tax=Dyella sp. 2RAB6 TaxID=3232992 RepID=UPI003F926627